MYDFKNIFAFALRTNGGHFKNLAASVEVFAEHTPMAKDGITVFTFS